MDDTTMDPADATLLDEVQALYDALDPVPEDLVSDVRIALTVQALHAEVAELVSTTALAVRAEPGTATTGTITFSTGEVSLMVAVEETADGVTLDGWVTAGDSVVEVHLADQVREVTADEFGRFQLDGLPHGRTWFVVHNGPTGEPAVVTPAIEL